MGLINIFNEHKRISEVMYGKNNSKKSRSYRFSSCDHKKSNGQEKASKASQLTGDSNVLGYINQEVFGVRK